MVVIGILSGLCASAFLYLLYDIFRCKHQWEFVDKTEFPAPLETAVRHGVDVRWSLYASQVEKMSKKTVVIVIRCSKCGTSKILRETH